MIVKKYKVAMLEEDGVEYFDSRELDINSVITQLAGNSRFTHMDCGAVVTDKIFHCHEDGTTAIDGGAVVNFDSLSSDSDAFAYALSSGVVTFLQSFKCFITYDLTTDVVSGTNRTQSQGVLELDTGSGFSVVDGSYVRTYNREINEGGNSGSATLLLDINIGDQIRVYASRTSGSSTVSTRAGGSRLTIVPIETTDDINCLGIDCGDVAEDHQIAYYDCGEI